MQTTHAAILAGGASRRMGTPKALIEIEGVPLIARTANLLRAVFPSLLVVTTSAEIAAAAELPSIADVYRDKGPLAGIHAALLYFETPVFCVACDMPFLNLAFTRFMAAFPENWDALMPERDGFVQPLHAIYTPACLPPIEKALQSERAGSVRSVLAGRNVHIIAETEIRRFDPTLRLFDNWNTPGDIVLTAGS